MRKTLTVLESGQKHKAVAVAEEAILARARECLRLEEVAIARTAGALDGRFAEVLRAVVAAMEAGRKLIFSGVGKNAPIGQKLAGTFCSIGAPAIFLEPSQALHGDLGLCQEGDLGFLLSNSGETEEVLRILPHLKRMGVGTVALTREAASTLAQHCDLRLLYQVEAEACPLNLAPTASTTAALAVGDALAMVYLDVRGLTRGDFARYHPAGTLGRSLLLRVVDIMRTGERFACAAETVAVQDALLAITRAKCGILAVTGEDGRLTGVFTDGDFRRAILRDPLVLTRPVGEFMTRHPVTISAEALAAEVLKVLERHPIKDLVVVDGDWRPMGVIDGQDLPKMRVF